VGLIFTGEKSNKYCTPHRKIGHPLLLLEGATILCFKNFSLLSSSNWKLLFSNSIGFE